MVSVAEDALEPTVTFDIIEGNILDSSNIFTEELTQDEKQEMYDIVTELDHVNSREVIDFTSQENAPPAEIHPCHKTHSKVQRYIK